eukprot:12020522-Alexandrium_andersonii.AAC.1
MTGPHRRLGCVAPGGPRRKQAGAMEQSECKGCALASPAPAHARPELAQARLQVVHEARPIRRRQACCPGQLFAENAGPLEQKAGGDRAEAHRAEGPLRVRGQRGRHRA